MLPFRDSSDPSPSTKILLVAVSIASALLTGGIVYGYSGLYKVLTVDEGVFSDTCAAEEPPPCQGQADGLTAAYTLGTATISGSAILVGFILDKVGPRVTIALGSLTFLLGVISLALVGQLSDSLIYSGFFFTSLGGPTMFNAMMGFAELYPSHSAMIIAAQNGMFDASSSVLFAMGKMVDQWGTSLSLLLAIYCTVPALVLLIALFYVADRPYGSDSGKSSRGELWRVYNVRKMSLEIVPTSEDPEVPLIVPAVSVPEELFNVDVIRQLQSPIFWIHATVGGYLILRSNFYISSVNSQMMYIVNYQNPSVHSPEENIKISQSYIDLFNYFLPIGGLAMVPVSGLIMTHLGMASSFLCIGILTIVATLVQVLYFLPVAFQTVSFLCYALVRPFIFGANAVFIGRIFGFNNFGRLYGINRMFGIFFTLLQYPLTSIAEGFLEGNYLTINIGFLVVEILITIAYPLYLWKKVFYGYFIRPQVISDE